jgi:predicted nucleic acid-binding protein
MLRLMSDVIGVVLCMAKRTYLDSGVLLAAFNGNEELYQRARRILADADRELLVSDAVWLETMPKAIFRKNQAEVSFYQEIFAMAQNLLWDYATLQRAAIVAQQNDIAGMDAIHIAFALDAQADEVVTAEKTTKPMFRTQGISVVSIREQAS